MTIARHRIRARGGNARGFARALGPGFAEAHALGGGAEVNYDVIQQRPARRRRPRVLVRYVRPRVLVPYVRPRVLVPYVPVAPVYFAPAYPRFGGGGGGFGLVTTRNLSVLRGF